MCEKSGWIHGAIRVSRCRICGIFFLPNLHPLTLMVKKLGSPCQDMKLGPQGVRSLAKLGSPCQDMKPGPQGVQKLAKLGSPCQDIKPGPQGVRSLAKLGSPCQDMKPGPQGVWSLAKLESLCQDMKPGPQGVWSLAKLGFLKARHSWEPGLEYPTSPRQALWRCCMPQRVGGGSDTCLKPKSTT